MTLPVTQDNVYLGAAQISGRLSLEDHFLAIEFQLNDMVLGLIDSGIKNNHIPLQIIDSIEVEKKWFSVEFTIYLNRLPDLHSAFQIDGNRITFSCKRKDFEKARIFKSNVIIKVAEQALAGLDEEKSADPSADEKREPGSFGSEEKKKKPYGLKKMLRNNNPE